jgi:hypothetical protein
MDETERTSLISIKPMTRMLRLQMPFFSPQQLMVHYCCDVAFGAFMTDRMEPRALLNYSILYSAILLAIITEMAKSLV